MPPFGEVAIDAIQASDGTYYDYPMDTVGKVSGYHLGTPGDGVFMELGGAILTNSAILVGGTGTKDGVTVTVVSTTAAPARRKAPSLGTTTTGDQDAAALLTEAQKLFDKLPKNKTSVMTKAKSVIYRAIPATAPSVSEMQGAMTNTILPVISDMIAKIRVVEGQGYEFTVTPAMTGYSETVNTVLDDGEFYGIDATLSGLKGGINILTAYNLDVDWKIIDADPLSAINGPSGGLTDDPNVDQTKFFTLKSDGATKMSAALATFKEAADKAELCYTYVFNEWGYKENTTYGYLYPTINNTDNGLRWHDDPEPLYPDPYDPYDFTKENDTDNRNALDAAQMGLKGQVTYTETVANGVRTETLTDGTTAITLDSEPTSDPAMTESTVIDVTKFFSAPLDRTDLPTMGYDLPIDGTLSMHYGEPVNSVVGGVVIYSDAWQKSDLPDKTLNGIFPNGIPDVDALIYLDNAVLLDSATWSGVSETIASDGTSIYLYKQDYWGAPTAKIWKIDPTTGAVTATYPLNLNSLANGIRWMENMTWHNGVLWVKGGYADALGNLGYGVFQIDPTTSTSSNWIPAPTLSCGTGCTTTASIGGIASDGTNLYAGIGYYNGTGWKAGVVKFTAAATVIPSSPFVIATEDTPWDMTYGGGYLWVAEDGIQMVNPSTGAVVKKYEGPHNAAGLHLNSSLWMEEDEKLLSFIAP